MTTPDNNNDTFGRIFSIFSIVSAWISYESVQEFLTVAASLSAIVSGSCGAVYYITKTRAIQQNPKKEDEE